MPLFDQNQWYQLNAGNFKTDLSLVGTPVFNKDHSGATFMRTTNTSDREQRWQIFPAENSTFILRTQGSGENVYLGVHESTGEDALGSTSARTIDVNYAGSDVFWRILPYDNGQFYLENVANGTAWHLFAKPNAFMAMTSNIAGNQPNQSFSFKKIGSIDNDIFSTFKAPALLATTATDSPSSNSPTSNPTTRTTASNGSPLAASTSNTTGTSEPSKGGLASGAKIGIGVGVAAVALIAILFGVLIFLRRRKRSKPLPSGPSDVKVPQVHYQHVGGTNDMGVYEADSHEPAELYGGTVHADAELPAEPIRRD